ncbi:MAG: DUF445 family protein [Candidatus Izemoplasma sp.]
MEILRFVLMVAIGGLIGYITNKVAIKMLFRPINPVKVLFFTVQGVFPKRKDIMAERLAETVEQELLSKDDIFDNLMTPENMAKVKEKLKVILAAKAKDMIPSIVLMMMNDSIENMIAKFIDKEGDELFNSLFEDFKNEGTNSLDIKQIVKDKIDKLDFIEFEKIIFGLMKKELKHIEVIGLFLGMLIGVLQFFITIVLA